MNLAQLLAALPQPQQGAKGATKGAAKGTVPSADLFAKALAQLATPEAGKGNPANQHIAQTLKTLLAQSPGHCVAPGGVTKEATTQGAPSSIDVATLRQLLHIVQGRAHHAQLGNQVEKQGSGPGQSAASCAQPVAPEVVHLAAMLSGHLAKATQQSGLPRGNADSQSPPVVQHENGSPRIGAPAQQPAKSVTAGHASTMPTTANHQPSPAGAAGIELGAGTQVVAARGVAEHGSKPLNTVVNDAQAGTVSHATVVARGAHRSDQNGAAAHGMVPNAQQSAAKVARQATTSQVKTSSSAELANNTVKQPTVGNEGATSFGAMPPKVSAGEMANQSAVSNVRVPQQGQSATSQAVASNPSEGVVPSSSGSASVDPVRHAGRVEPQVQSASLTPGNQAAQVLQGSTDATAQQTPASQNVPNALTKVSAEIAANAGLQQPKDAVAKKVSRETGATKNDMQAPVSVVTGPSATGSQVVSDAGIASAVGQGAVAQNQAKTAQATPHKPQSKVSPTTTSRSHSPTEATMGVAQNITSQGSTQPSVESSAIQAAQISAPTTPAHVAAAASSHQAANATVGATSVPVSATPPPVVTAAPDGTLVQPPPASQPAAPVAAPSAPLPPPAAQSLPHPNIPMPQQVLAKMNQAVRSLGAGAHEFAIRVNPEALGPVRVVATVKDGQLNVELQAANAAGRDMLKAALPEMRRDLLAPGLTTSVDVSSDNNSGTTNQQGRAASQGDGGANSSRLGQQSNNSNNNRGNQPEVADQQPEQLRQPGASTLPGNVDILT